MPYYLPSDSQTNTDPAGNPLESRSRDGDMSDLKVFWGPEICRLEYLIHLMDTGRIVDERTRLTA